ncbi:MAG: hypothetical protein PHT26_13670 [Lentimicrobiaceae bacterium]|nr:hypothetical protein [Lentimicrobiaceae bacterium]
MYTSYIGKKFLKLYNERQGENLSAKQFFREIQFPIFFDSDKHLMHVHGSTFFQSISEEKILESGTESLARLKRLQDDILNGRISGSTYAGYAAGEVSAVTSGQVTTMNLEITEEEIYFSWIGQGLAIGLKGGLLFVDDEKVLWLLFNGWKLYRKHHNQIPNLKPRQIETWNGQWLFFGSQFKSADSINEDRFQIDIDSDDKEGGLNAIRTIVWVKIVFALSRIFGSRTITTQAFVFSKTNTSYGFVNIYLQEIRKIFELRELLFDHRQTILKDEEIEGLTTFYSFRDACKLGTIGLKALEPAKLRDYMPKGSFLFAQGNEYKFSNEESFFNYKLFKIWIIAMLNKTELLKLAAGVAAALIDFEKSEERGKKVYYTLSQEVKESNNLKTFIDKMTEILEHVPANAAVFKEVVEQVLKMPYDSFPLFVTLIKFEYAFQKIQNN